MDEGEQRRTEQADGDCRQPEDGEDFPGRELFQQLGLEAGLAPEHLQRDLKSLLGLWREQGSGYYALEAISLIAAQGLAAIPDTVLGQVDLESPVVVPWWAVLAIARGWGRYRLEGEPLNQAFDVGPAGQANPHARGPASPLSRQDKAQFQAGLAMEVAWALKAGDKLEYTVGDVANRRNVAPRTVRKAWADYGEKAQAMVGRLPECKK